MGVEVWDGGGGPPVVTHVSKRCRTMRKRKAMGMVM